MANLFFSKPTIAMTNSSGDGRAGEWAIIFLNTTIAAGHRQEQWVYDPSVKVIGDFQPRGYLYLTDDVLTAIQELER